VIFLEGQPAVANAFKAAWFGSSVPAGLQVGTYSGSSIGLSTDGDAAGRPASTAPSPPAG